VLQIVITDVCSASPIVTTCSARSGCPVPLDHPGAGVAKVFVGMEADPPNPDLSDRLRAQPAAIGDRGTMGRQLSHLPRDGVELCPPTVGRPTRQRPSPAKQEY
jgi:hypothetical protein